MRWDSVQTEKVRLQRQVKAGKTKYGNCCLKNIYVYCPYFKSWHCKAKNNTETSKQRKNNL